MSRRYARCPKCGGTSLSIIEFHDEIGHTDFAKHIVEGRLIIPAGDFWFDAGNPTRVDMECSDCSHYWRSRRKVGTP
jgi:hypothetical protein